MELVHVSSPRTLISVIICTRNRAGDLKESLESFRGVALPGCQDVELVLVNNGSIDQTAEIIASYDCEGISVRPVHEPQTGKGNAYNAGLAAARGSVFLFADDDIRFPRHWLAEMSAPILAGEADAVAGGVRMAAHLERPWMKSTHRLWMAETDSLSPSNFDMIGANMSFASHVLSKVPAFDPELGPGATGLGEDTLFSSQLVKAGYRVKLLQDVLVEHHFHPGRLTRAAFLSRAEAMGRSLGYIAYHWSHKTIRFPGLRFIKSRIRLELYRKLHKQVDLHCEGADMAELERFSGFHFYRQFLREQRRPRNYEPFGLVKRKVN